MKIPALPAISFSLLAFTSLMQETASALPHVWTSKDGRELTGDFLKSDARTVTVSRGNGKTVTIPLDMLNPDDLKYVSSQIAESEAAKKAAEDKAAEEAEAKVKGKGSITYKLSGGSENWPEDRRKRIVAAMDAGVEYL